MAKAAYNSRAYQEARRRLLADSPVCHWCQRNPATTADHLIEVDAGGERDLDQLVPACRPCNSRRGAQYRNAKNGVGRYKTPNRNAPGPKPRKTVVTTKNTKKDEKGSESFLEPVLQDPAALSSVSLERNQTGTAEIERANNYSGGVVSVAPRLITPAWGRDSFGPAIGRWAESNLGMRLMPWQEQTLRSAWEYEVAADGFPELLHRTSTCSVARQNGKSLCARAEIGWALLEWPIHRGEPVTVISTAHNLNLAESVFKDLAPILEERYGAESYWSSGRMSITLPNGSKWLVQSPRPGSFHGYSPHLVLADEIWGIKEEIIMDGAVPSQRARRSPLLRMYSTAGTLDSTFFIRIREQALRAIAKGKPSAVDYMEWSPTPDANVHSLDTIRQANPAVGFTITDDTLLEEARDPADRTAWLRGSLNMWVATAHGWLEPGFWPRQEWQGDTPPAPTVLAVEVDADGSLYGGVFGTQLPDGTVYVSTAFIASSADQCWEEVARVLPPRCQLIYGASLGLTVPATYRGRSRDAGWGEVAKYTAPVRSMIMEGRLWHDGNPMLSEHVGRSVATKARNGALTLSTGQSPGCIILTRAMVWAAAHCAQGKRTPTAAIYTPRNR